MIIKEDKELTMLNSMKIPSKVKYYIKVKNSDQIIEAINFAQSKNLKYFILGNGSNTLFAKEFYKNMVIIDLKEMRNLEITNNYLFVEAGVLGNRLLNFCKENSIGGFEFLAGIPGTIGGMVYMNAGAFGSSIGDIIEKIKVLNLKNFSIQEIDRKDLKFVYRKLKIKDMIIVSAFFKIKKSSPERIAEIIKQNLIKRKERQPIGFSLGSVFKNGKDYYAGALIEKCGFKGKNVGDMYVSEKHANFIINRGKGKGKDMLMLMQKIEGAVFDKFTVMLEREVNVLF